MGYISIRGSVRIPNSFVLSFIHSIRNNGTHSMSPNKHRKSHQITWNSHICFMFRTYYWNDPDMQSDWKLWKKNRENDDDCDVIWYMCISASESLNYNIWCTEIDGKWMYELRWRHSEYLLCVGRNSMCVCVYGKIFWIQTIKN